ncbi:glucose-induced degradation protein [Pseudoscourfieldia marina]
MPLSSGDGMDTAMARHNHTNNHSNSTSSAIKQQWHRLLLRASLQSPSTAAAGALDPGQVGQGLAVANPVHALILDFLVTEGHADAAVAFARESASQQHVDTAMIKARMKTKQLVMQGDVDRAIDEITREHPAFWDEHPSLLFHLKLQKLLQLIRAKQTEEALACARDDLAHISLSDPEKLNELERAVSLLAFDEPETSPLADMLAHERVKTTASRLNAALLAVQSRSHASSEREARCALVSGKREGESALSGLFRRLSLKQQQQKWGQRVGEVKTYVRWDGTLDA